MKRRIYSLLILAAIPCFLTAQAKDYKVVFDLTSKDSTDQKSVVRWINEILNNNPGASLEVVLYGQSVNMAVKEKSIMPDIITKLCGNGNVSFKVCAIAMKRHNINSSQLLAGVQTVPDGIYEIISKQREGWGYIKVSH